SSTTSAASRSRADAALQRRSSAQTKNAGGGKSSAAGVSLSESRKLYEVISHQFLLISLSRKWARPLVSRGRSSVMPSALPLAENSLCASSTSSGVANCKVNRLASVR